MNPFVLCCALSTRLFAGVALAGTASTSPPIDQATPVPPPGIYDPQEGPFIIRLNDRNEVDPEQLGVVKNAVRSWSGEQLQAFQICYSQRGQVDWHAAYAAMTKVSRELKLHGARAVLAPNGLTCRSPHQSDVPGAYVEINGVLVF